MSVDDVLRQVLADSDSDEEYRTADDDVQSSGEVESAATSQRQLPKDASADFSCLHLANNGEREPASLQSSTLSAKGKINLKGGRNQTRKDSFHEVLLILIVSQLR